MVHAAAVAVAAAVSVGACACASARVDGRRLHADAAAATAALQNDTRWVMIIRIRETEPVHRIRLAAVAAAAVGGQN
jgi:hypothetical protein